MAEGLDEFAWRGASEDVGDDEPGICWEELRIELRERLEAALAKRNADN